MGCLYYSGLCLLLFSWVASTETKDETEQKRFEIDIAKRIDMSDLEGLEEYPAVTDVPKMETSTEKQTQNFSSNPSRFDPVRGFVFYKKRFDPYLKRFNPYEKRFDPYIKRFNPNEKRFDPLSKRFNPYEKRFDYISKRFDPYLKRFDGTYGITDESDLRDKRFDPYSKRFDVSDQFDSYSKRFDIFKRIEEGSKRFEPFKRFEPYSKRFDIFKRFDPFPYSSSLNDYDFYPDTSKRFDPSHLEQYWGQLNTKRNIFDPYAYHVGFGR